MIYDVRDDGAFTIEEIVFSEAYSFGVRVANRLKPSADKPGYVKLSDQSKSSAGEYVYLRDKEQAKNLIKALEKAIELGWLE